MTKEELLKKIDFEKSWLYDCGIFGSDVDIAFHAIKKSVIETLEQEPKEGHWFAWKPEDDVWRTTCSECGEETRTLWDYCPNCGAKMIEPQESEEEE